MHIVGSTTALAIISNREESMVPLHTAVANWLALGLASPSCRSAHRWHEVQEVVAGPRKHLPKTNTATQALKLYGGSSGTVLAWVGKLFQFYRNLCQSLHPFLFEEIITNFTITNRTKSHTYEGRKEASHQPMH